MGSVATTIRGWKSHKYHFCGRCTRRVPLSEMKWEAGVLVCKTNDCQDSMLPQERDANMARITQIAGQSKELQLDPKISDAAALDLDEVEFVP